MRKWICGFLSIAGFALVITGILYSRNKAVAIIGGADGPTSIFIAGKPNPVTSTVMIGIGMIIILGTVIIIVKNR